MVRSLFAAVLSLAVCAAPAAATTSESGILAAELGAIMEVAEAEGFGGVLIVRRGGQVVLSRGYGFAYREAEIPFTTRTVAQIGSITKTFTAAAVASLIAEGRVDPQAAYATYVTDAPEPVASATVDALLTHHSGLRDYCGDDFERLTEEDFLRECLAAPLVHEPGTSNYANAGYSAMALLIQRVAGSDWEDYLRETVWKPLGLERTGFRFDGVDQSEFAAGYLDGAPQDVISRRLAALDGADWNLRGNGGMQASSEDMMAFLDALTARPCGLRPEVCELMTAPHSPPADGVAEGYGLFFRYDDEGRLVRLGHSGSDGTFFSYLAWYPRSDVRLYFVGNNGEAEVRPVLVDLLRVIAEVPPTGE